MKNYMKKIIKTTVIHFISLSLAIAILFSIAYAAISWPSSTPSGETAWWKFMSYFNNMFTSCGNWDVIVWYTSTWSKICKEVWSDWIKNNSLTASDLAAWSVWTSEVENNSLTASDLAAWSVWTSEVENNSLTQSDIADNAIWNDEMKNDAIGSNEVINWSLTLSDLNISIVRTIRSMTKNCPYEDGDCYSTSWWPDCPEWYIVSWCSATCNWREYDMDLSPVSEWCRVDNNSSCTWDWDLTVKAICIKSN